TERWRRPIQRWRCRGGARCGGCAAPVRPAAGPGYGCTARWRACRCRSARRTGRSGRSARKGGRGRRMRGWCAWISPLIRNGSDHANRFHFVVLGDLVHHVLPFAHLSEHGVDAVEVRLCGVADEKLAAPRVLAGVGHGERARDVLVDVLVRLALDRVARPAGADPSLARLAIGIAALDHAVGYHAMTPASAVEPRVGALLEGGDRARRLAGEQAYFDAALDGLEHG